MKTYLMTEEYIRSLMLASAMSARDMQVQQKEGWPRSDFDLAIMVSVLPLDSAAEYHPQGEPHEG